MPGLVRKLLIFAAADGLILQPQISKGQRPAPVVRINYQDNVIEPVAKERDEADKHENCFEAFGIIGLLTLPSRSFLISITRRQQVAQIQGKPIYVVTEVALTPLSSKSDADSSIARTSASLQKRTTEGNNTDSDSEEDDSLHLTAGSDDVDDEPHITSNKESARPTSSRVEHKRTSSVAEDVMTRKGSYGRFAGNFFSKKGWNVDQRRNLGMSVSPPDNTVPSAGSDGVAESTASEPPTDPSPVEVKVEEQESGVVKALIPKLLRTTQILFGSSRSFFFSYDHDITRSFANRRTKASELPLHIEVDPLFFWNRHVIQPFIDAGQSSFVLPLMQGFVGQRSFQMDTDPPSLIGIDGSASSTMEMKDFSTGAKEEESAHPGGSETPLDRVSSEGSRTERSFLLTLISRRSVKRAGLRYLRRGVDEEGNTANGVETEQILSSRDWTSSKVYSFVQVRGSVPIFFSQTPFSFKPVPQLQHSPETNFKAFKKHFEGLSQVYGKVEAVNLVEKHGNEAIVGNGYEGNIKRFNEEKISSEETVGFEWFDFHAACKGMKFENVSLLMDAIGEKLDGFGNTIEADGQLVSRQNGVLRTNCMDCLDRTNVVQSACGRRVLEQQLKSEGIDMGLQVDQSGQFFNTLWADNGDAVSKQYASTAAMKGDFTRTGKRDYKGALADMGFSIARFYSGIVNDYFSQAAIDFLLGNVTSLVFEDFEANMMSADPGVSMQKIRQQAIDVSQKIVVADDHEEFIGGWTLLTPHVINTIKSSPFEEAVLLLTDSALYSVRFDWNTEKVLSFERIDLTHIVSIKYGTYITSTLSPAQADEKRNVGFVVTYKAGSDNIARINTRSMSTSMSATEANSLFNPQTTSQAFNNFQTLVLGKPDPAPDHVLAFKALPSKSAVSASGEEPRLSEIENIKAVCSQIERMVHHWQEVEAGTERKGIVTSGDIISLAEARKSTGILEQLGHSLKKLVWA